MSLVGGKTWRCPHCQGQKTDWIKQLTNEEIQERTLKKAVYSVLTAGFRKHPILRLATADYNEARERFKTMVEEETGVWETFTLTEWIDGNTTTLDRITRS